MVAKQFTHHHFHRGYHALTFITSVVLVAFFAWILGIALASVNAQPITENSSVQEASTTPVRSPEQKPNAGSFAATEPTNENRSITVVPGESIQQRYVLRDGEVQPVFIFRNQYPKFIGLTNIQDSTAVLDVFGPTHVTGKARLDSNGNWAWEPTVPLKPGTYNFNVKAVKGSSNTALAKDSLLFEIVLDKNQEVDVANFKNVPQLGNGGVLFDVRTVISEQSKIIEAGSNVDTDIRFVNVGSAGKAVDVEVRYTITNEADEVVSVTSETLAIVNELEYSKSFFTSSALPAGTYTLTVAVPSQDLIATASDTFEIRDKDAGAGLTGLEKKSPFSSVPLLLEIVGIMLFLGVIIAYMEYNKVVILSKHIKHLSEKDLLKPARS